MRLIKSVGEAYQVYSLAKSTLCIIEMKVAICDLTDKYGEHAVLHILLTYMTHRPNSFFIVGVTFDITNGTNSTLVLSSVKFQ